MNEMRCMKPGESGGDEVVTWDPDDAQSVANAQQKFQEMTKEGHRPFPVVDKKVADQKGGPLKEFDPQMKEIVFLPPMAGG